MSSDLTFHAMHLAFDGVDDCTLLEVKELQ
jgi:hypothetical protein